MREQIGGMWPNPSKRRPILLGLFRERSLHTGEVAGSIPAAPTINPHSIGSTFRSPLRFDVPVARTGTVFRAQHFPKSCSNHGTALMSATLAMEAGNAPRSRSCKKVMQRKSVAAGVTPAMTRRRAGQHQWMPLIAPWSANRRAANKIPSRKTFAANTAIASQCFRLLESRNTAGRRLHPTDPTNCGCTTTPHDRTSRLRPTVHFGRSLFALAAGFLRRRSLARAG